MMSAARSVIRIATRASRLALWQAHHVATLIQQADPNLTTELVEISTAGDRNRTEPLSQMGGLGVFTREVQFAVLDGRADVAVHSLKDLPTTATPGLLLAGVPARGPRFDALILSQRLAKSVHSLEDLPRDARIGTGSLRRQAQLLHRFPHLLMAEIRGNIETRVRKLDEGEFDAIILAEAGLDRLGLSDRIQAVLKPPTMFPAVGQAALGMECRADDPPTEQVLRAITDAATLAEVTAERACLSELRAGCHAPVGVLTEWDSPENLRLQAIVLSSNGRERVEARDTDSPQSARQLGERVARQLKASGAEVLLDRH